MKKLLLIFTFVTIFGFTTPGQTVLPSSQPGQAQENWQTFAPSDEEFSVEAPAAFMPGYINSSPAARTKTRSYKTLLNGIYYYVFSDSLKNPDQNKVVFRFAGSAADSNRQNVVFKFADKFGYYHRILTAKTPNRIYTFQTVSETENNPQSDRFFAGIKIGSDRLPKDEPAAAAEPTSSMPKSETLNPVSESQIPTGGGRGSGIGTGNGSGANTVTPVASNSNQTTARKILSKPRANYTDLARFYDISGSVMTKVTFLANGTIGAVTPVRKLPFGLTEEAIIAAKSIKFTPAMGNGQPFNTIAMVQYVFTIY